MITETVSPDVAESRQPAPTSLWSAGFIACLAYLATREQPAPPSPWMTVDEVAEYSGHHPKTIYAAVRLFEATNGRKGLRGYRATGRWHIHREDVDAWIKGEKYGRRRPLRSVG